MPNNLLAGVKCPSCGNNSQFDIEATVVLRVTRDRAETASDTEWNPSNWCICGQCEFQAPMSKFTGKRRKLGR
jgi:hypothetical protein